MLWYPSDLHLESSESLPKSPWGRANMGLATDAAKCGNTPHASPNITPVLYRDPRNKGYCGER